MNYRYYLFDIASTTYYLNSMMRNSSLDPLSLTWILQMRSTLFYLASCIPSTLFPWNLHNVCTIVVHPFSYTLLLTPHLTDWINSFVLKQSFWFMTHTMICCFVTQIMPHYCSTKKTYFAGLSWFLLYLLTNVWGSIRKEAPLVFIFDSLCVCYLSEIFLSHSRCFICFHNPNKKAITVF